MTVCYVWDLTQSSTVSQSDQTLNPYTNTVFYRTCSNLFVWILKLSVLLPP